MKLYEVLDVLYPYEYVQIITQTGDTASDKNAWTEINSDPYEVDEIPYGVVANYLYDEVAEIKSAADKKGNRFIVIHATHHD